MINIFTPEITLNFQGKEFLVGYGVSTGYESRQSIHPELQIQKFF
jgi:hypothetical protein